MYGRHKAAIGLILTSVIIQHQVLWSWTSLYTVYTVNSKGMAQKDQSACVIIVFDVNGVLSVNSIFYLSLPY